MLKSLQEPKEQSQAVGVVFARVGNSNGLLLIVIENKGTW